MSESGGSARRRAAALAGTPSASAWSAGAEGERRVAAALSELGPEWTVLHDRLLHPGLSEANLDHVLVGPGGVFLVDAKNWAGNVNVWNGSLFRHKPESGHLRHDCMDRQVDKVLGMAAEMEREVLRTVIPVLCLAGGRSGSFGAARQVRGVTVVPVGALVPWLRAQPVVLDTDSMAWSAARARMSFPDTDTDAALLMAMGRERLRTGAGRSLPRLRSVRPPAPRPAPRRTAVRAKGRGGHEAMKRLFVAAVLLLAGFTILPTLATSAVAFLGHSLSNPSPTSDGSVFGRVVGGTAPAGATPSLAAGKPCQGLRQADVQRVLGHRAVHVADATACLWGTRLDDASTTLVAVRTDLPEYDPALKVSASDHRVVYGTSLMIGSYRPSTLLTVAQGQPLTMSKGKVVSARATIRVEVGRAALGVSDDRARAQALALAVALNRRLS